MSMGSGIAGNELSGAIETKGSVVCARRSRH